MNDFSDLWASSNPVKSQKPASYSLGEAKSNLTNTSRSSTPDTFNLLASTHSSRPNSRSITPAIQKTPAPLSRPSSNNDDVFRSLVSLGSKTSTEGNLTIAERAALAERERQQKVEGVNATFGSQTSFWDRFENSASQIRATSGSNPLDLDFLVEPLSQQQNVVSSNNHDLSWDLDFIISESATSTTLSPSDMPGSSKEPPTLMSVNEDWDDVNFGGLNKSVHDIKLPPEKITPPPDIHRVSNERSIQRSLSPPPHILGKIVEMGFSVDQAKTALAATSTGLDVNAALELLLQNTSSLPDLSKLESRPIANVDHKDTIMSGEGTSSTGKPFIGQQGLQDHADRILSQASSIGLSMFHKANVLWKEGRDKVVKAYEEQRTVTTEIGPKKGKNRPNWMDAEPVNLLPDAPSPPKLAEASLVRPSVVLSPVALAASNEYKSAGTIHFKLGRFAEAEDSYSQALEALPASHLLRVPLHNNRALTRLKTGEYKGTVEDTTEVLHLVTLDLGTNWHPGREASVDDQHGLGDAVAKALRRRAEAFEGLEKWEEASLDWERLTATIWINSAFKKDAVTGLNRCRRMTAGSANTTRSRSLTKPVPVIYNYSNVAVSKLRAANEAQEAEEQARHVLKDAVDTRLQTWRAGKENNIRALIASLDTILSSSFRWQKVGMAELVTTAQVKLRYNKAIAKVHPDKLNIKNTTLEERMIANGVFNTLNDAIHAFYKT